MGRKPKQPDPSREMPRDLCSSTLQDAADLYVQRATIRQSPATARQKRNLMKSFVEIVGPDTLVWQMTRADLERVYDVIVNGYSPADVTGRMGRRSRPGRNTKLSRQQLRGALRTFAMFCHEEHWLGENVTLPKRDLFASKQETMEPAAPLDLSDPMATRPEHDDDDDDSDDGYRIFSVIPRDEWDMVLDVAEYEVHPRLRIAIALALYGGRRTSEICRLKFSHIDQRTRTIRFKIKKLGLRAGDPRGLTVISPELQRELDRWRRWVTTNIGVPQPGWYVVPAKFHPRALGGQGGGRFWADPTQWPLNIAKRIYPTTLNEDVRKMLALFGIGPGEGTGMHTFRRSAAVWMADEAGLETAQAMLGHESIATTQLYTRNREGYKKLHEKHYPGEKPAGIEQSICEWGGHPGPFDELGRPADCVEEHFDLAVTFDFTRRKAS